MNALALALPGRTLIQSERDALWEHSRNSLGIARLLVREGRPEPFVATACHAAVESALRAALEQAGLGFEGHVDEALRRLEAPAELWEEVGASWGTERLAAAERAVAWCAGLLRHEVPERPWGY